MHFDIQAFDTELSIEARAYLEFRVFSALTRLGASVFAVRVAVRRDGDGVGCRVRVLLRPAGEADLDVHADRLYAAIDAVADAIAGVVQEAIARPAAAGPSARSA